MFICQDNVGSWRVLSFHKEGQLLQLFRDETWTMFSTFRHITPNGIQWTSRTSIFNVTSHLPIKSSSSTGPSQQWGLLYLLCYEVYYYPISTLSFCPMPGHIHLNAVLKGGCPWEYRNPTNCYCQVQNKFLTVSFAAPLPQKGPLVPPLLFHMIWRISRRRENAWLVYSER